MTYRMSKNEFYEETTGVCPISDSAIIQMANINTQLKKIAQTILDQREAAQFDRLCTGSPQLIYELGAVSSCEVMQKIPCLKGYFDLHKVLKTINADFRFQVLPSAGMMRPVPCLLLIVESFRCYASNKTDKNAHMYPVFGANDNGRSACAMIPMRFHFA